MSALNVVYPDDLQLLSLSFQRDGWHCTLRCDDSWKDDTGQSLFAMAAHGKSEDGPQKAINAAVARVYELVAEINAEIPLRKENRAMEQRLKTLSKTQREEVDELSALLGL